MDDQVRQQLGTWLDELRKIGTFEGGGMWRSPFTDDDVRAKEVLSGWMSRNGLEVSYDNGGNLIGRLVGSGSNGSAWCSLSQGVRCAVDDEDGEVDVAAAPVCNKVGITEFFKKLDIFINVEDVRVEVVVEGVGSRSGLIWMVMSSGSFG